ASTVCNAATKYARKRARSRSPSSTASQAAGRLPSASHSPTSVVFPKPAGAEMRVSLRCSPSFRRSVRRGRRTTFGPAGGGKSFVARSGVIIEDVGGSPDAVDFVRSGVFQNRRGFGFAMGTVDDEHVTPRADLLGQMFRLLLSRAKRGQQANRPADDGASK